MDATLSLGLPRMNVSGTLLEGIALWGELKPLLTHEAVAERAIRWLKISAAFAFAQVSENSPQPFESDNKSANADQAEEIARDNFEDFPQERQSK